MPTLKKSIKAVRDALKEAEKQTLREADIAYVSHDWGVSGRYAYRRGRLAGLKLAQRILDQVFPQ